MIFIEPARNGTGTIAESYKLGHEFVLVELHVGFTRIASSGTETAELTVVRQGRHQDATYRLATIEAAGVGRDALIRDYANFGVRDSLDIAWTTPDGSNIAWFIRMRWRRP